MKTRLFPASLLAALAVAAVAAVIAGPAAADNSVLTSSGWLYEVSAARYGDALSDGAVNPWTPVLVLTETSPDGGVSVEAIPDTIDSRIEIPGTVEYEPQTNSLFVIYMQASGLMTDVRVAVRRAHQWSNQDIRPTPGLYLSLNPRAVVTRQQYVDVDSAGRSVQKTRSILSLVWWEEGGSLQARYAPVFVEDGILRLDSVVAYNLNELAGSWGPTDAHGLPYSAFQFPAIQRDPNTNGGVVVSFANLADLTQTTLRLTFPDDVAKLLAERPGDIALAQARAHVPVGRDPVQGKIPGIETQSDVGAFISPSGVTNFYWQEGQTLRYVSSGAAAGAKPKSIQLRKNLSLDKAVSIVREMTARD